MVGIGAANRQRHVEENQNDDWAWFRRTSLGGGGGGGGGDPDSLNRHGCCENSF